MREHLVAGELIIVDARGPGESRTGAGKGLEPHIGHQLGRSGIPGIGNDETARFMQVSKLFGFRGLIGHLISLVVQPILKPAEMFYHPILAHFGAAS